ncbi:MAG TPA: serine hydrolase domain-containing protein [Pyrinomonadaceae bacterium]|nr:serine hydrolase domain-containing protein [Pyrinomonadaceae bacterium]
MNQISRIPFNEVRFLTLASCLVLIAIFQPVFAQSSKSQKIDALMKPFVQANQFSGVVLASENGKVIYEKAFGLANADYKIPNQVNTRIGIASITKLMTSVILTRLIEQNKIAAADKLAKYIPDFPNGDKITIEMLARHRSGIPHRVMPPEMESVAFNSAEFVDKVKQAKLAFEPGTARLYSSAGYAVLARALEIASGKTYAQLLQENVFTPAGMTDSVDFDGEAVIERRAQDYYLSPNGLVNVPLKNYSFLVGAGSVYGTARDVYRFAEAVLDGKYGPGVKASFEGQGPFNGSGSTNGHRSYFEMARDKKFGFVIVSNNAGVFDLISRGVKEILEGKEPTVKSFTIPTLIPNPNKNLAEFLGHYKRADGGETDVVLKGGFLYSSDIKLYPIKPDCFFEYRFFGEACFIRDETSKIREIKWKGIGFDLTWLKQ